MDFASFGLLRVIILFDLAFLMALFVLISMDFLCLLKPLDVYLAIELAAIFAMLLGPTDLLLILLKVFVTHEFQSKVTMSLGAFNRRVHEPMHFAFTHQWVEDVSLPHDLKSKGFIRSKPKGFQTSLLVLKVSYRLTFSPEPALLILFSIAPPKDLIVILQVVAGVDLQHALVAIMDVKAMQ